jgi:N6-adenosine-specific RNA methylase IME4
MAQELAYYSAARNALAAAVRKDEVADIENKASRMIEYAKRAKDGELVGYATEIKKHAERRLGEIMEDDRKAGKLAKAGRPPRNRVSKKPDSLTFQGIDKNLADRARKAAKVSEKDFDATVAKAVRLALAATEGNKEIIAEARAERHVKKKEQRNQRERKLADKILALPNKKYAVIVADPEWKWEAWSEKGLDATSADNHYSTSATDAIKARDVPSIAADDCVLFLWATVPMMPHALEVIAAWGFAYVSQFVWVKNKTGTGYWNRNQHELLLIGTKGKIPAPAEGTQFSSVINARVGKHSAKPEEAMKIIETYYPTVPRIELNCRGKARPGWDAWGDEVLAKAAE